MAGPPPPVGDGPRGPARCGRRALRDDRDEPAEEGRDGEDAERDRRVPADAGPELTSTLYAAAAA